MPFTIEVTHIQASLPWWPFSVLGCTQPYLSILLEVRLGIIYKWVADRATLAGIIVSMVIFQQGVGILQRSYADITDAGISQSQLRRIVKHLDSLTSVSTVHSFSDIRGRSAGAT